ncbi:unnamed protein product [Rotaria sp. Silwood2]|nr:unnamed protein product [Rotaria sp. Silwood2]CAF2667209.1 unnamed protein product [Rotaria sp. Silwood2]CAF4356002.1 unnamed protein product [Rotaria sp. Silwood2]CAF4494869.1 unnamed protein product [Rotaria sp. Silwood2]
MSFRRSLSASPVSHCDNSDKAFRRIKDSSKLSFCQVCGDKANIMNYGALSCQSCKTFFRRNGFHPEHVRPCFFNKSCEVNINTRRNCTACRFAKCLSAGMSPDLIRKEIQQRKKCVLPTDAYSHHDAVHKRVMPTLQVSILDQSHNDLSSLNKYERTLLSNIIHAHDAFSAIPQIRRTIENLTVSFSCNVSYNVSNVFEILILMYTSMESFISSSPDFRILTTNEQCSLFERNLHGMVALSSALYFHTTGIIDTPKCLETFVIVYGSEMMLQVKHANQQLDPDLTVIKLMLIVLAFSSNCFIVLKKEKPQADSLLNGTFHLFGSQNVYVELLWKYLIYKYDHYNAVIRFSQLIGLVLNLVKYSALLYTNNEFHYHLVNEVLTHIKQSFTKDQNIQKPLWGKTEPYNKESSSF